MKKIKFMLLSLALLAVVGGALAFKAKYQQDYCTTIAKVINGASTCYDMAASPTTLTCSSYIDFKTTASGNLFYCTTTPDKVGGCSATLTCITTLTQLNGD